MVIVRQIENLISFQKPYLYRDIFYNVKENDH